ncbi:MAG: HAMP domain-containing sensor histidine kinase [Saprospiraceae bacterium]|nr:HAMP domain-containing sensor histidine kinase [Saprospiraceae bacterium]
MRLITRAGLYYLCITACLCILAGFIFYGHLSSLLEEEMNEQLAIERKDIRQYIAARHQLPESLSSDDRHLQFIPVTSEVDSSTMDTFLLSPLGDEMLPYRQHIFPVFASGKWYKAILSKPMVEKDDLLDAIARSLGLFLLLLLIVLIFFNQWIAHKLWSPFYKILDQLRSVQLQYHSSLSTPPTRIKEFNELRQGINRLLNEISHQYLQLKDFTDHASHEIQTPLAVIRSKLELLLQKEDWSGKEWEWISDAITSTGRLSRLTQSLLLLSRIENRQFSSLEAVDLGELIRNRMEAYEECEPGSHIKMELFLHEPLTVQIDPSLADILVSNILQNAIKHNVEPGQIKMDIHSTQLTIANTGRPLSKPSASLFQRFNKDGLPSDSPGLGLAIVERICSSYGFRIAYHYNDGWHSIQIVFS